MEESARTLQRIERLRQLNSAREWVNDDLYRLMYKEDLYIVAYERIKSAPGNRYFRRIRVIKQMVCLR